MITREEILERIYKVAKTSLEDFPINKILTEDMRLIEDLNLDSLDKIEIWLGVEEEFMIEIPDGEVGKLFTLKDAVDLVIKYLKLKNE